MRYLLAIALSGCATTYSPPGRTSDFLRENSRSPAALLENLPGNARQIVLREARSWLQGSSRHAVRDCYGFVLAAYAPLRLPLAHYGLRGDNGVAILDRYVARHGRFYAQMRPALADLVFFKNSYDVDGDGLLNDGFSHVGIVDSVDSEGTVTMIHRANNGVIRSRMNLAHPTVLRSPTGEVWNDFLRSARRGIPAKTTAQLFVSYGAIIPSASVAPMAARSAIP